jgi:predicted ATPase
MNVIPRAHRILVTGGPGAGKTALISGLAERGHTGIPDSARAIIRSRKARGLSPRPAPAEFARQILSADVQQYSNALAESGHLFFERGIPDALCMLDGLGLLAAGDVARHRAEYPYFPVAFVLPPWQEIYRTDTERDQTFAEAVQVYETVHSWYRRCGYEIVTVPPGTVPQRCAFVLDEIERQRD